MTLLSSFINTDSVFFAWVVLPLLIMLSRILDQTLGSLRLIFLGRGEKRIVPILGFFEVIIWLVAVAQVMKHLDNIMCYIAYGGGFALGNYIGMRIEEKLSLGTVIIRVIPRQDTHNLVAKLRESNYGVTVANGEGRRGPVQIVFSIIKRSQINEVVKIINDYNPQAFYTIEDVRAVKQGVMKNNSTLKTFRWGLRKN